MNISTDEEENFFRLYKLVVRIGTKAVREKFDQIFPPSSLYSTLKTSETALRRKIKIRQDQDALLFPSSGMPSSNDFDLTLMISLIRNLAPPCPPPIKGYDELPSPTETSLAADLARMKWYRNSFSHAGKPEIDISKYTNDWQLLSETITRIGGPPYKVQCDTLNNSHLTLDELNCLRKELVKTKRSIEQMCTLVDAVADKHKRLEADTKALIEVELSESTFVETEASRCALELLKQNGVVLLTGGAGTGKSRMGLMVLRHFQLSNSSYRAIKLNTIDEWQALDKLKEDQEFIILFDDIFGETNCTFNKGRNEPILDQIYAYVQKGNVKVVITIRNTIKQHCAETFENHRLFRFDFVDLNAPKYHLLPKEKKDMLVRHFSRTREGVQLKDGNLIDNNGIILSPNQLKAIINSNPVRGFPLTVYRFVNNKKFLDLESKFFTSPTDQIMQEINEIRRKGKDNDSSCCQYAVLVYTALNGNSITTSDNTIVHEIYSIVDSVYGKAIRCKKRDVIDAIEDMLKQIYLIKDPSHNCFHFSHITLQESVILSFADTDENSMNKIIPMLSLSFIVEIARSSDYTEKEGEIVLKVPQKCYPLIAERVMKLCLANENDSLMIYDNISYFLSSEIFDKRGDVLLGMIVDSYLRTNKSYEDIFIDRDIFGVCPLVVLLRRALMMKPQLSNVVLFFLHKVMNENMQSSPYCKIVDDCKAAIVELVYKLCSTEDVKAVTDALHIAKQSNIHVSEDQFILEINKSTINIYKCIAESFSEFNLPVMLHFREKLKDEIFDVNLFFKRLYVVPRKSISLKSIEFLRSIAKFDDNIIEWMIKLACESHLLPEVKYFFALKDRIDTNTVYIECFLECNCKHCVGLNVADECRNLFKFLLTQFYHNVERINRILNLMQKKMSIGGMLQDLISVVDRRLLNFNAVLSLACRTADVEIVKWVLDNVRLEELDIKSALSVLVLHNRMDILFRFNIEGTYFNRRRDIIKYLISFSNLTLFNVECPLYAVWMCGDLKIIQNFLENVKHDLINTTEIITRAIMQNQFAFLEWIVDNGHKLHLDFNMALIAFCTSRRALSFKFKTLIEKLWQNATNKEIFDQRKIVDEACNNGICSELFFWFLEVFDHKLIDINKMLTVSYRCGYFNVVKYIVEKVDFTLFEINMNLFLEELPTLKTFFFLEKKCMDITEIVPLLLSNSRFTIVSLQILMHEAIRRKLWNFVKGLLIHCGNDTSIFDMKTIVHDCSTDGEVEFLSWMLVNEGTKHCIQFMDIDMVMTEAYCGKHDIGVWIANDFYAKDHHRLLTQIWNKIDTASCDMNSIIKKVCSYKTLNVGVLKWIVDNVDHDSIDLDIIVQSCCRNAEYMFVKHVFSKVDKEKIDVKSAFLEACRSDVINEDRLIGLIDFLLQKCGANKVDISGGVDIAIHNANYRLIYYFLAKGLCKDTVIDMKTLLNYACLCGEYDMTVWIMQNIPKTDLDLPLAFTNACICGSTDYNKTILPSLDLENHLHASDYNPGLSCAVFILDNIDTLHMLDHEAVLSIASDKGSTQMGEWLQYILKSRSKYFTRRAPEPTLQQRMLTEIKNTETFNISLTSTDINSPTNFSTSDPKSLSIDHSQHIIPFQEPSTAIIKDDNEGLEPSVRNILCAGNSKEKRPSENDLTSDVERSYETLKKC